MSGTPDEQLLIRYLLGELPEEERSKIEQLCLESDEAFEELEAVEAELTDDYVRGVLVGRRREEFEKRFLTSPSRAEEIQFAKLIASRDKTRSGFSGGFKHWFSSLSLQTRWLQASTAAAAVALVVAAALLTLRNRAPGPESSTAVNNVPLIATFALNPGGTRGEGANNEVTIPRDAKQVRFRIEVPSSGYQSYSASLNRVEGERLFAQSSLKATLSKRGETLAIEVPANILSPGTAVLSVTGIGADGASEDVSKYVIRIHAQ